MEDYIQPVHLEPGQARPLAFQIILGKTIPLVFSIQIVCLSTDEPLEAYTIRANIELVERSLDEPHKFTFRDSGGKISYAILRPAKRSALEGSSNNSLPILINLHGAGLEADSEVMRNSLNDLSESSWTLFPTGGTTWSSDDWHTLGWANVEAAIKAIPEWISTVNWNGPGVSMKRWVVVGHSNGGQGVWYALAHRPDNIIAAAPVSAYSSIQGYVPYTFWQSTDPFRMAIIHSSLGSYRHEVLVPDNAKGLTIAIQHGDADNNVPPYHARYMNQMISQVNGSVNYQELASKGHWFDGVMTTSFLQNFYEQSLDPTYSRQMPDSFVVVVANPADTDAIRGLLVESLSKPGQLGKIHAAISSQSNVLRTSNIRSFSISDNIYDGAELVIDSQHFHDVKGGSAFFTMDTRGFWKVNIFDSFLKDILTMHA